MRLLCAPQPHKAIPPFPDWQNNYARFASSLKQELRRIEDAAARREAIERMRTVLTSYQDARKRQQAKR